MEKQLAQKGFSLVEVMIGGAILAGLGLAGAYIFKSQRTDLKKVENLRELQEFHQHLTRQLVHPRTCNKIFGIADGGSNTSIENPKILFNCVDKCDSPESIPYFNEIEKGAWISNKEIWQIKNWTMPTFAEDSVLSGIQRIEMDISYELNPKFAGQGYPALSKKVMFGIRFGSDGFPKECIDLHQSSLNNLQNDLCNSNIADGGNFYGGDVLLWNDNLQRCSVRKLINADVRNCEAPGLIVKGVEERGTAKCVPIYEKVNAGSVDKESTCPPGSNNVQLVVDASGKVKVVCN